MKNMNKKHLSIINSAEDLQKDIFYRNDLKPFECTDDLLELLKKAIKKKQPFSLVRLGDGEGRILGYPESFDKSVYINQVIAYQFGKESILELKKNYGDSYLEKSMTELKSLIIDSVKNADIIGAPSYLHFRNELTEKNIIPRTAQSLCLLFLKENANLKEQKIFDHFIFKPFNKKGGFIDLLSGLEEISVISHTDQSIEIKEYFNIKKVNHIKIPGHQSFLKSDILHFPENYKITTKKLETLSKNKIFLVAAGYLGKHYCNTIKINGGIAIDIGSIFDSWFGKGRIDAVKDTSHRLLKNSI